MLRAARLRQQHPHEIIDEIYSDVRNAVVNEISQVQSQFKVAAKEGAIASELELISMLHHANEQKHHHSPETPKLDVKN